MSMLCRAPAAQLGWPDTLCLAQHHNLIFACCRVSLRPLTLKQAKFIIRQVLESKLPYSAQKRWEIIDDLLSNAEILVQVSELGGNPKFVEIVCRALYSANAKRFLAPRLSDWSSAVAPLMRLAILQKVRKPSVSTLASFAARRRLRR